LHCGAEEPLRVVRRQKYGDEGWRHGGR
jgi:hypothetical protein